jgi:hypothetical protein
MPKSWCLSIVVVASLFCLIGHAQAEPPSVTEWQLTRSIAAEEAKQAAAADEKYLYAIDNRVVAKYDRQTGERVTVSTGEAHHLNSGFFLSGKLYCAHSNYPRTPELSEIKVLDVETMKLTTFKDFGDYGGSLTWAIHHDNHWWCNFARYGKQNGETFLVKFDCDWKEVARWTYAPEVIEQLGTFSLSGGVWHEGTLLTTDHDHRRLYRLRLPKSGEPIKLVQIEKAPFTGQGIASDPVTGGLVGIDRAKKTILLVEPKRDEP